MEDLEIFKAQVLVQYTYAKIQDSVDDIKKRNPHRTDLITSMESSLADLQTVRNTIELMEKELRFARSTAFRLERIGLELKAELKELKNENEMLKTGL